MLAVIPDCLSLSLSLSFSNCSSLSLPLSLRKKDPVSQSTSLKNYSFPVSQSLSVALKSSSAVGRTLQLPNSFCLSVCFVFVSLCLYLSVCLSV